MASVAIHSPKTPVTKGCNSIARATIPNVCKMPGPPAPFVPSPLPNIAKSGSSPKGYSTTVKIEGSAVAIRGCSHKSMGDMASKSTGGGLLSANTHGPAKFITPGSMTVKIQGKAVHLLGEPMLNNCGASGMPPNTGATMNGTKHGSANVKTLQKKLKEIVCKCNRETKQAPKGKKEKTCAQLGTEKHQCCEDAIQKLNHPQIEGEQGYRPTKPSGYASVSGTRVNAVKSGTIKGTIWPDCTIELPDGKKQIIDFKFKCPEGTPVRKNDKGRWIRAKKNPGKWPTWTKYKNGYNQKRKYTKLSKGLYGKKAGKPAVMTNKGCRK